MPKLDTAVLLAAGRGTRLRPLTDSTPKPLLEIAGRPLIAHVFDALERCPIREIIVVTGHLPEQLDEFCERYCRDHPAMKIASVRQGELNGTAGALVAAAPALFGSADFIFGWGDILMDAANYSRFIDKARAESYDLMLAVNWTSDPWRGAAVYVDEQMHVRRIVEKPPKGSSSTNWNNAGLFAATPAVFDYIRKLERSERGEFELPQAIRAMIEDGLQVRAVDVRGFWSDIGTPEELVYARERFRPDLT